ncbi:MAG: hypothetical protein AB1599_04950 [Planctomycetota bacterium]
MKSTIIFLVILFLIAVAGIGWGVYEFQDARGMKTSQTVALVKSYLARLAAERRARKPKPVPETPLVAEKPPELRRDRDSEPKPEEPPEEAEQPEKPLTAEPTVVTPVVKTTVTPTEEAPVAPPKTELRRAPKPEKPKVKPEAQDLVDQGNKHYDQGIVHLQNTFKKDSTFDKENTLAIEKFRQAMAKYLDAEKIDGESLWLRNRIRETNSNIVTCRKQARRK